MVIDTSTEFGARVAQRLQNDYIIWLTTVRQDLTPQPSPVWFLWDGTAFLIYSRPKVQKLRNITRSPFVGLHFDGNGQGGDIVIFAGRAEVVEQGPLASDLPAYIDKYRDGITRIGMTPETFAQTYSVALRIIQTELRGH